MAAAVAAVGVLAFAGCGSGGSGRTADAGGRLDVVATTAVVADFVRNVGGDRVHVVQILKPGVDPHDYEASVADIQAIADADLVVKSGVGLEAAWLDDTVRSAGYGGEVVDASRGVTVRAGNGDEEQQAGDPHIWHDPANARIMVDDIAAALAAKDPAGTAGYERSAAAYDAELATLDAENKAEISTIPVAQRKLVTNHDAFGYYCARYGITFVGSIIPSFDTSAELSGKGVSRPGREDQADRRAGGLLGVLAAAEDRGDRGRRGRRAGRRGGGLALRRRPRPGRLARRRPTSGPSGTTPRRS